MQTVRLPRSLAAATHLLLDGSAALLEAAAFWVAVALPFAYLPMLALGDVEGQTLGLLFVVNLVAFRAGHGHADP